MMTILFKWDHLEKITQQIELQININTHLLPVITENVAYIISIHPELTKH